MTPLQFNLWLSRAAGFGPSPDLLRRKKQLSVREMIPAEPPNAISVITAEDYAAARASAEAETATPQMKRELRQSFRERTMELGRLWLEEMGKTPTPLGEKAALFWHGHFATRIVHPLFDQQLIEIFRTRGLGRFEDLLVAVSKSAAMLRFLNANQNRKGHPNENFAREVMELFTLGRGNYTENDIKEAARAFTGWTADKEGNFAFRRGQHDDGQKTIFGKTGNFDGDDVLQMLVARPETSRHIALKAWRFFVSDTDPSETQLAALAKKYRDDNLDFTTLLQALLTQQNATFAGTRIRGPVELLAGYQRAVPVTFAKPQTLVNLQRGLGQMLLYPPNVGGWPGGRSWIDSSSLALRMRLPEALYGNAELELRPKELDAEMNEVNPKPVTPASAPDSRYRLGRTEVDWKAWEATWESVPMAMLPRQLADFLLPVPVSDNILQEISRFADRDSPRDWLRTLTIRIMGMPEYQLA